jgi:hypothetical protein
MFVTVFLVLLFKPENEVDIFLRIFGFIPLDYATVLPSRQNFIKMIHNPFGELSLPISHLQLTLEVEWIGCLQLEAIGDTVNRIYGEGNLMGYEVNKSFNADMCYDMKIG